MPWYDTSEQSSVAIIKQGLCHVLFPAAVAYKNNEMRGF
jgi:hypothetical protein